jgi:hypothetical protein
MTDAKTDPLNMKTQDLTSRGKGKQRGEGCFAAARTELLTIIPILTNFGERGGSGRGDGLSTFWQNRL